MYPVSGEKWSLTGELGSGPPPHPPGVPPPQRLRRTKPHQAGQEPSREVHHDPIALRLVRPHQGEIRITSTTQPQHPNIGQPLRHRRGVMKELAKRQVRKRRNHHIHTTLEVLGTQLTA